MTDFNYLKQENVTATAQVTHKDHSKQNMYSVLYSYDKNISKLVIPVIVAGDQILDFETIKRVRILLTFIHEGLQKSIEDIGVIESAENKTLSYIVTDKLKGFVGQITMNIYLDLTTDQQIDLAEYGFSMKQSTIDQNIPEIEQFYFKSLDDVIVELQQKSKEILDKVNEDSISATKKVKEIEDQIAKQNIVKKSEQFKPTEIVVPTAGADDLNNYTNAGYYICRTNPYAVNFLNTPVNIAFNLEVQELISANKTAGVNQLLTTYHTSNAAFRRFSRNLYNGTWSMWREIPFLDQVQSYDFTEIKGQDWNTLKTSSIYWSAGATGANRPTGLATYGYLEVFNSVGAVIQRYTSSNTEVATRYYSPSANSWSAWAEMAVVSNREMLLRDLLDSAKFKEYSASVNDRITVRRSGNIVQICGTLTPTTTIAAGETSIFKSGSLLPSWARPRDQLVCNVHHGTNVAKFLSRASKEGDVLVGRYSEPTTNSPIAMTAGVWLPINIIYIV